MIPNLFYYHYNETPDFPSVFPELAFPSEIWNKNKIWFRIIYSISQKESLEYTEQMYASDIAVLRDTFSGAETLGWTNPVAE